MARGTFQALTLIAVSGSLLLEVFKAVVPSESNTIVRRERTSGLDMTTMGSDPANHFNDLGDHRSFDGKEIGISILSSSSTAKNELQQDGENAVLTSKTLAYSEKNDSKGKSGILSQIPGTSDDSVDMLRNSSEKVAQNSTVTMCRQGITSDAPHPVTIFVQNPRTGSFFMSGRLQQYGSGRFTYKWVRTKELSPRPTTDLASWRHHACIASPGYKIIAYDSGASPNWWLKNWPANTVLVMTGDEMGRWGLNYRSRYWGPFGTDKESFFYENKTSPHRHILLPPTIRPWFRQYYDPKQADAFSTDAIFWPLGSRVEFPTIPKEDVKLATDRIYIYSLMAAMTDHSRKRLILALNTSSLIPANRGFTHMAANWHPEVTNTEYLKPARYAKIMLESTFVPCPKGRNIDTFRMYEAIEAGAIPVIELDSYAKSHLPPHYLISPMLFVDTWEEAPAAMMALYSNTTALLARQKAVMVWYDKLMTGVVGHLESLLENRSLPLTS